MSCVVPQRLQSPRGIRVTYVMAGAKKEPRNLRLLGYHIVPTKLSLEELQALDDEVISRGSAAPVLTCHGPHLWPLPRPPHARHRDLHMQACPCCDGRRWEETDC